MFEQKHEMLRKLAKEFAEKELEPIAGDAEKNGCYPPELWQKPVPEVSFRTAGKVLI